MGQQSDTKTIFFSKGARTTKSESQDLWTVALRAKTNEYKLEAQASRFCWKGCTHLRFEGALQGQRAKPNRDARGFFATYSQDLWLNGLFRSRFAFAKKNLHNGLDGVRYDNPFVSVEIRVENEQTPKSNEEIDEASFLNLLQLARSGNDARPEALAGGKAYVAGSIFDWLEQKEIQIVIPNRKNENKNPDICKETYRQRNVVERLIGKLKQLRRLNNCARL